MNIGKSVKTPKQYFVMDKEIKPKSVEISYEDFEYYRDNFWKIKSYDNMIKGLEHFNIKITFELDRGDYIGYNIETQSDDFGIKWER